MRTGKLKNLGYALFFGVLWGFVVAYALAVFVPQFYTEWAGSMVCPGKIEYLSFKQSYYCFTGPNSSFNLGEAMFWAIFKRFILPAVAVCFVLTIGFMKLAVFLYQRKDAAGF